MFGVYVFAIKAGPAYTPIYVEKTKRNFKRECFTSDRVDRPYSACLGTWAEETPVLFFLVPNKRLSNVQYKAGPVWGIRGVERGGSGKAPAAAREFKRAISWKSGFSVEVV